MFKMLLILLMGLISSCGFIMDNVSTKDDSSSSSLLPPTLSGVGSSTAVYLKTTDTILTWFASHSDSVSYVISVYNGSSCSGNIVSTDSTNQTTYFVQNMVNGQTYSVSIASKRGDQKSRDVACSPDFIVDLDAPTAPAITDPASAMTISSNSYTLQWSSSDVGPSGLHLTETYKIEQFSNGGCTGTATSTNFVPAGVHTLTALSNGSVYTLKVTAKDRAGNFSAASCSAAITVNTSGGGGGAPTISAPTSFELTDTSSTSPVYTNSVSVTVAISGDGAATKWCVSETQAAPPSATGNCTGGGGATNGWYTARPTTVSLSAGDGLKIVYFWIADSADAISANPLVDAITLDTTNPGAFTIAGITGGSDALNDAFLSGTLIPTVNWAGSAGATSYTISIRNQADSADVCAAVPNIISTSYTFSGCTLVDGTSYNASVTAIDGAGNSLAATLFSFGVDNTGPSAFSVSGISGGTDVTSDALLLGATTATVTWGAATGAADYTVSIRNQTDTADACAPVTGVTITNHTFTGCTLTYGTYYKARVIAYDASRNSAQAANSPFLFQAANQPGAFNILGINGTGDFTIDGYLSSTGNPLVTLSTSVGAESVDVKIYDLVPTLRCQALAQTGTAITVTGCGALPDGGYTVQAVANAAGGTLTTNATNNPFSFVKDVAPPTTFSILGVTGGLDTTPDPLLTNGVAPTLNWADSTGELSYRYIIYEADGSTPKCGPFDSIVANSITHTGACTLVDTQTYVTRLYARDSSGNEVEAANSPYTFTVETASDLILDGTGGSTLNGVLITGSGCTAGGACGSANPYSLPSGTTKYRQIKLQNGAYLTSGTWVSGTPAAANGMLTAVVNGNVDVCATCRITMDARGYTKSNGPGSQPAGTSDGGSHGGEGGRRSTNTFVTYGSIKDPQDPGSGGSGNSGCAGARGGGAVVLTVTGQLKLNGLITAIGNNDCNPDSGGAGGSVNITAYEINGAGTGSITVNGGGGWDGRSPGGGGRVALKYSTDTYTGGASAINIQAYGGTTNWGAGNGGGAGTIYLRNMTTEANGKLYVRNANNDTVGATPIISNQSFDEVVITGQAYVRLEPGLTLTAPTFTESTNGELRIETGATFSPTSLSLAGGIVTNIGTFGPTLSSINFWLTNFGTINLNPSLIIANGGTLEVGTSNLSLTSLTIANGGKLSHVKNTSAQSYTLDFSATTLTIDSGGSIDVSYKGYQTGYGPGTSTTYSIGASYGGQGGDQWTVTTALRNPTYGSIKNPVHLGSGGGTGAPTLYYGLHGGGLAKINVSGTLTLNGSIKADGSNNTHQGGWPFGASSGGTLHVTAGTFAGAGGSMTAIGGSGWDGRGAGGGGRIAFYYTTDSYTGGVPNFNFQAFGNTANYGGRYFSAGGTSFYKDVDNDTDGHLIVDNNNIQVDDPIYPYAYTPFLQNEVFDSVTVKRNGRLITNSFSLGTPTLTMNTSGYLLISSGTTFSPTTLNLSGGVVINSGNFTTLQSSINYSLTNFGTVNLSPNLAIANGGTLEVGTNTLSLTSLSIANGGKLSHVKNLTTQANILDLSVTTLTIDTGGSIDVSLKGYQSGAGPGSTTLSFAGASYGGQGGDSWSFSPGVRLPVYGSIKNPNQLGSGGGVNHPTLYIGTHGGGYAKIDVSGTLTLNGSIKADGSAQTSSGVTSFAGGSGGTVHLTADTIAGAAASITANGGAGWDGRGAGSGGRIAVYYTTDSYAGGVSSINFQSFGNSANYGGRNASAAGTIFYKDVDTDTNGHLIVDNNNVAVDDWVYAFAMTPLMQNESFDTVTVKRNGRIDLNGFTLTAPILTMNTTGVLTIPAGITFNPTTINLNGGSIVNYGTFSTAISSLNFGLTNFGTLNLNPNLTIASGGTLEVGSGALSLTSLTISSGGKLSHTKNMTSQTSILDLSVTTLTVDSGGSIDVSYKGYQSGSGPGSCITSWAGASYGGQGGDSWSVSPGARMPTYGSVKSPNQLGSGGCMNNGSGAYYGTHGGGYAKINVSGTLTLNGSIKSDGGNYSTAAGINWGAGSGGTIHVTAGTIAGATGSMTASGGSGWDQKGSGGGGRIAVYYTTDSYTGGVANFNFQAFGQSNNYGPRNASSAGTVFFKDVDSDANGHLIIDNNNIATIESPYTAAKAGYAENLALDTLVVKRKGEFDTHSGFTFSLVDALTVASAGVFRLSSAHTINPSASSFVAGTFYNYGTFTPSISNVDFIFYNYGTATFAATTTIANGGQLYHGANNLSVTTLNIQNGGKLFHMPNTTAKSSWLNISATTVTMDAGSEINVDGLGYAGSSGPGVGASNGAANQGGGGGGYGAAGGNSQQAIAGGAAVQTSGTFDELGSGGGAGSQCAGGSGGGLVILNVSGTLTLNGTITADGKLATACSDYAGGGGSGGAINLTANTLVGSTGSLRARGGSGQNRGGGGAGGRIKYTVTSDTYSGTISALPKLVTAGTSTLGSAGSVGTAVAGP